MYFILKSIFGILWLSLEKHVSKWYILSCSKEYSLILHIDGRSAHISNDVQIIFPVKVTEKMQVRVLRFTYALVQYYFKEITDIFRIILYIARFII